MWPWWVWLIIAVIVLVLIITAIAMTNAKKATSELDYHARMQGWHMESKGTWHEQFAGEPFNFGYAKRSRKGIHGQHGGVEFTAFQYHCITPGDKGQQHQHTFSVLVVPIGRSHDGIRIKRRHLGHRIQALLGKAPKATGRASFDRKWVAIRNDREDPMHIDEPLQRVIMRSPKLRWTWREELVVDRRGALTKQRLQWMLDQAQAFRHAVGDDDW